MGELSDYLIQHDDNFRKARIPALYSDFRSQKSLNPDGYWANVSAWRSALARLASHGLLPQHDSGASPLVLNLDTTLLRSLENRQFGQPLALGTVVREAVSGKDLVPLHDFLNSSHPVFQQTWSKSPWNAVGWALRQLGMTGYSGEDKLPTGQYVIRENLETASKALVQLMPDNTSRFGRVATKSRFRLDFLSKLFANQPLSETDVDVLLRFLSRDKQLIEFDGQTIRFRAAGESGDITNEDAAMARIKEMIVSFKAQAEAIESQIEESNQAAKNAVVRKNRITALAALKSKKRAEGALSARYAALSQLDEVAGRMEQASDQVQLVKILESSAVALRNLNAEVGGVERVDSVVDHLGEQMKDTDEIGVVLSDIGRAPVDDSEIDEELAALERQGSLEEEEAQRKDKEREAERVQKELDNLPPIPADPETSRTPTSETGIAHLVLKE
ncbi:hypothetical protein CDD83_7572 [Cordyceps sp. RAO-2017]|nr:hypothetical protein CDD83_7572 [Cordyceps sp. RAO-2017]